MVSLAYTCNPGSKITDFNGIPMFLIYSENPTQNSNAFFITGDTNNWNLNIPPNRNSSPVGLPGVKNVIIGVKILKDKADPKAYELNLGYDKNPPEETTQVPDTFDVYFYSWCAPTPNEIGVEKSLDTRLVITVNTLTSAPVSINRQKPTQLINNTGYYVILFTDYATFENYPELPPTNKDGGTFIASTAVPKTTAFASILATRNVKKVTQVITIISVILIIVALIFLGISIWI
jgi:hypothetical protein